MNSKFLMLTNFSAISLSLLYCGHGWFAQDITPKDYQESRQDFKPRPGFLARLDRFSVSGMILSTCLNLCLICDFAF